jgi:endonuclease/exonuclease/phosphatase family metal-dependent hydrolase
VVTWGQFQELKSGKKFFVFNTHFDHLGKVARRESAKLVLAKIKEIAQNSPVILLGDFNASPDDEPIQILVAKQEPERLTNSQNISQKGHYGPKNSFNGFKAEKENSQIDYIFVKNGVKCLQHSTHSETWNNRYPSDHFPVSASLTLP